MSQSAAPAPVQVSGAQSGQTRTLQPGQRLEVALSANPSTGYVWAIDGALPSQLTQVGEPAYIAGSAALGAAGMQKWTFAAASTGNGTLTMKYWRSFEPTAPPVQTFTLAVQVK